VKKSVWRGVGWDRTGYFNRIHQAGGLAYGEKLDRKQVDTLNSVCQHEFGIGISNG
jgi:hypothetical protein